MELCSTCPTGVAGAILLAGRLSPDVWDQTQQGNVHDGFLPNGQRAQGHAALTACWLQGQDEESYGPSRVHRSGLPSVPAATGRLLLSVAVQVKNERFLPWEGTSPVQNSWPGPALFWAGGGGMAQLFCVFEEPQEMPRVGFSLFGSSFPEPSPYRQDREHLG